MEAKDKDVFEDAVRLEPEKRAKLIDVLLASLDKPDEQIDRLWAKEVEDRISAYERGEIKGLSLEDFLQKYK